MMEPDLEIVVVNIPMKIQYTESIVFSHLPFTFLADLSKGVCRSTHVNQKTKTTVLDTIKKPQRLDE